MKIIFEGKNMRDIVADMLSTLDDITHSQNTDNTAEKSIPPVIARGKSMTVNVDDFTYGIFKQASYRASINQLALEACKKLIEAGKTHILPADREKTNREHPRKEVIYITMPMTMYNALKDLAAVHKLPIAKLVYLACREYAISLCYPTRK